MRGHRVDGKVGHRRIGVARVSFVVLALLGACSSDDDSGDADAVTESTAAGGATDETEGGDQTKADGLSDEELQAELDQTQAELDQTQTSLDASEATVTSQEATINDLTTQLGAAQDANTELTAELETETARADQTQSELDAIAALFPVTVNASLAPFEENLIGAYTLTLTEAYCDDLPTCGTRRPPIRADIIQGANGLLLQVPTVLTAGLFLVEGSLFAVTDSTLILPPCNGVTRNSRVNITIFADGIVIAEDGSRTLSGLGGSLLVDADAVGGCDRGAVFFDAQLTPV